MRTTLIAVLLFGVFAHARAADDGVARAVQKNLGEFLELLAIPNVADEPADVRRNADFVKRAFERRGFAAQLLTNPASRPLVFARLDGAPGANTILFYIHLDG